MTTGYSGSYAINGVTLQLSPTQGRWNSRDLLGLDGEGRPIYPAVRNFELTWQLMSVSALEQLINSSRAIANTGTAVVDLPKWAAPGYLFYSYSGTFINEPQVGAYFAEHVEDVRLIITNIRTD